MCDDLLIKLDSIIEYFDNLKKVIDKPIYPIYTTEHDAVASELDRIAKQKEIYETYSENQKKDERITQSLLEGQEKPCRPQK